MLDLSFKPGSVGTQQGVSMENIYTLENYHHFFFGSEASSDSFNTVDMGIFLNTIFISLIVTILNLIICYPIAFYIAKVATGSRARLFILALIVPFWINELLRAFAFRILFANNGAVNNALIQNNIIDSPIDFISADLALYAGLTYAYMLLMIFPLYNAIESLDISQIEASEDLGASTFKTHFRVVIPYAKPGIVSGCTMVFMLSAGALATPYILSSVSTMWFTQLIYQWFHLNNDWARGSAYSWILLVACIAIVLAMMRIFKVRIGEIFR